MLSPTLSAGLAVLAAVLLPAAHAAPSYQITDLGNLGGTIAQAMSVNNRGQVVGTFSLPDDTLRAFVYSEGRIALQEPGLWSPDTYGWRINESGDFLTNRGLTVNGELLPPAIYATDFTSVNNFGQYTGSTLFPGNVYSHPYIASGDQWSSTIADLGTLERTSGGPFDQGIAVGTDINDAGQVAGYSSVANRSTTHAFVYANGQMTDLGTLGGDGDSYAYAINQSGQIAGQSNRRAFLYDQGQMLNLGTLADSEISTAIGINDKGEVVGESYGGTGDWRAFLYSDGQMHDLGNLLSEGHAGWRLKSAMDINELGVIVGTGYFNGEVRAFLATPVPEPGAALLMALGVVAMALARRRHAAQPCAVLHNGSLPFS